MTPKEPYFWFTLGQRIPLKLTYSPEVKAYSTEVKDDAQETFHVIWPVYIGHALKYTRNSLQ